MPHTDPPAAPGGDLTPEAAAEHTRRVNACLEKFGDMPTELIEAIPGTVDGQMMHLEEHIQNLSAALDLLITLNTDDDETTLEAIAKARAAQAAAEEGLPR